MYKRFRFQKKQLAFFMIVPLLTVTALIKVGCPVCQGTGDISSTPSMDNVQINNVKYDKVSSLEESCGMYVLYQYNVELLIQNHGSSEANGWVELALKDITHGQIMSIRYISIMVPANTELDLDYPTISFESVINSPPQAQVTASVETGKTPCSICGGTGKVPLNMWFFVKVLSEKLQQVQQSEVQFTPPIWIPSDSDEESGFITPPSE